MAQEQKRGCGYRKVHGLYLVSGGAGTPCDRLPFELGVCPCCSQGIKPARGWTWIDPSRLFQGPHCISPDVAGNSKPCVCHGGYCVLCGAPESIGRAGLLWIGEKFYKTPDQFVSEGVEMGFSRRIKAIPQGFKIGQTWVMLAHKKAVSTLADITAGSAGTYKPGIFFAWKPECIEKIMLESERGSEEAQQLEKRGITPVFVPDDDRDHQGNVHDDFEEEAKNKSSRKMSEEE